MRNLVEMAVPPVLINPEPVKEHTRLVAMDDLNLQKIVEKERQSAAEEAAEKKAEEADNKRKSAASSQEPVNKNIKTT